MAMLTRPAFQTGGNFGSPKIDLGGCVFYAPLWREDQKALTTATFQSSGVYGIPRHTCTVTGAIWTPPTGYVFDGDDQISLAAASNVLLNNAPAITNCFWFKAASMPGAGLSRDFIFWEINEATQMGIGVSLYDTNKIRILGRSKDGDTLRSTTIAFTDTTSYHFLVSIHNYAAGTLQIILDGVAADPVAAVWTQTYYTSTCTTGIPRIGCDAAATGDFFVGGIGEIFTFKLGSSIGELERIRLATKWRFI